MSVTMRQQAQCQNSETEATAQRIQSLLIPFFIPPLFLFPKASDDKSRHCVNPGKTKLYIIACPYLKLLQFPVNINVQVGIHRQEMFCQHTKPVRRTERVYSSLCANT